MLIVIVQYTYTSGIKKLVIINQYTKTKSIMALFKFGKTINNDNNRMIKGFIIPLHCISLYSSMYTIVQLYSHKQLQAQIVFSDDESRNYCQSISEF